MEAGAAGVKRPGHFCPTLAVVGNSKLPSQIEVIRPGAAGSPAV